MRGKAKCILPFCCGCLLYTNILQVKVILVMVNQLHSKHLSLHIYVYTSSNPHLKRVRKLFAGIFSVLFDSCYVLPLEVHIKDLGFFHNFLKFKRGSDTSCISSNLNSHSDPANSRCCMISARQKHLDFSK